MKVGAAFPSKYLKHSDLEGRSVNVTINPGEHVGLIGRNGAGKSSLFALLNGSLHEDGGDFQVPAHWRMAQVAQAGPKNL